MAAAPPRRRARYRSPVPQKNCDVCSRLMTGIDGHSSCVMCLGPDHAERGLRDGGAFCAICGVTEPKFLRKRAKRFWPKTDSTMEEFEPARARHLRDGSPTPSWGENMDEIQPLHDTPELYRMENMEEGPAPQQQRRQQNAKKNRGQRKQQQKHSSEIVFTKGSSIKTIASLVNQLQGVTEPVIGLHYVWEYRSPSKSVPPHYQCKLCAVSRLQNEMLAHIKGWRHGFKYMKRVHPNKITGEEEDAKKDPAIRKQIREIASEVEKAEGRGQLKVILKEPCDVPAFKGLQSAIPKMMPPKGQEMGTHGPRSGGRFPGEFTQAGPHPNFKKGGRRDQGFGGYAARPDFPEHDMGSRQFPDGMGHHPGGGDGFGRNGRRDDFGMSGRLVDSPGRRYPDEFRGGQMGSNLDGPMDRQMDRPGLRGAEPESSSLPSTLLNYLDSFRIENESDAQIVLKVTQKLTDVLMDYRLRSVSTGPSMNSSLNNSMNNTSVSSMGYSSPPSRMPSAGDHYSGGRSGPSRYSDGPSRFYN